MNVMHIIMKKLCLILCLIAFAMVENKTMS